MQKASQIGLVNFGRRLRCGRSFAGGLCATTCVGGVLMKVTNWCKKLSATLVAAGLLAPAVSYAVDIPLGDPSFEAYSCSLAWLCLCGRPAGRLSADQRLGRRLGLPAGIHARQWRQQLDLYLHLRRSYHVHETACTAHRQPGDARLVQLQCPRDRGGLRSRQDLHVFAVVQNDELLNETNGAFLYLFDGTVPFSDANSLG